MASPWGRLCLLWAARRRHLPCDLSLPGLPGPEQLPRRADERACLAVPSWAAEPEVAAQAAGQLRELQGRAPGVQLMEEQVGLKRVLLKRASLDCATGCDAMASGQVAGPQQVVARPRPAAAGQAGCCVALAPPAAGNSQLPSRGHGPPPLLLDCRASLASSGLPAPVRPRAGRDGMGYRAARRAAPGPRSLRGFRFRPSPGPCHTHTLRSHRALPWAHATL